MDKLSTFLWKQRVDGVIHDIKQGRKPPFGEAEEPGPLASESLRKGQEDRDGE